MLCHPSSRLPPPEKAHPNGDGRIFSCYRSARASNCITQLNNLLLTAVSHPARPRSSSRTRDPKMRELYCALGQRRWRLRAIHWACPGLITSEQRPKKNTNHCPQSHGTVSNDLVIWRVGRHFPNHLLAAQKGVRAAGPGTRGPR